MGGSVVGGNGIWLGGCDSEIVGLLIAGCVGWVVCDCGISPIEGGCACEVCEVGV